MKNRINYLISKGWSVYPQTRPLENKSVEICLLDLDGATVCIGEGLSTFKNSCGICIIINNILIDSNRSVLWKYI